MLHKHVDDSSKIMINNNERLYIIYLYNIEYYHHTFFFGGFCQ